MADAMQETDSAIELTLEAIKRLKVKNPAHELLQFSTTFAGLKLPESFIQRFGGEHIAEWAKGTEFAYAGMCMNYYNALCAALQ